MVESQSDVSFLLARWTHGRPIGGRLEACDGQAKEELSPSITLHSHSQHCFSPVQSGEPSRCEKFCNNVRERHKMGRVARYKKIKSFDPYSRENGGRVQLDRVGVWGLGDNGQKPKKRSKTSEKLRARKRKRKRVVDEYSKNEGFDVPPEAGDDFNLEDLVGTLKKQVPAQNNEAITVPAASAPRTSVKTSIGESQKAKASDTTTSAVEDDDDHMKANKLLKLEQQVLPKSSNATTTGKRMEGESKRAYHRRVKAETRQIIKEQRQENRNPEKKQRKKDFLNKKKKRKGANRVDLGRSQGNDADVDGGTYGDNDILVTAELAIAAREVETAVRFGEQAERPPSFRQLPRGATRKAQKHVSGRAMDEQDVAAEQEAMELVRRKALAQYQAIKVKRRSLGDFHL